MVEGVAGCSDSPQAMGSALGSGSATTERGENAPVRRSARPAVAGWSSAWPDRCGEDPTGRSRGDDLWAAVRGPAGTPHAGAAVSAPRRRRHHRAGADAAAFGVAVQPDEVKRRRLPLARRRDRCFVGHLRYHPLRLGDQHRPVPGALVSRDLTVARSCADQNPSSGATVCTRPTVVFAKARTA